MTTEPFFFCFGLGHTGLATARRLKAEGWRTGGTVRSAEKAARLQAEGIEAVVFSRDSDLSPVEDALSRATHVLQSIPLDGNGPMDGDVVYDRCLPLLTLVPPAWFGYLSTTVVYGNHDGGWVDETTPVAPTGPRGRARVAAEQAWSTSGLATHIFRLAGIYGPGRNALVSLRKGKAKRIDKPGQVFSRIHVDDIATTLIASMAQPAATADAPAICNVCDDEPCPPAEVIEHAAGLLGMFPPPLQPFDPDSMTPMARSFYSDNKRVSNRKIKDELGVELRYPTYREGLAALLAAR